MNVRQYVEYLKRNTGFMQNVACWRTVPARQAQYAPFPNWLDGRLVSALREKGVSQLYCHQAQALEHAAAGRDMVVVTPTASGKTLCYNLPVLNAILQDPDARALYLFPTKALGNDQSAELYGMIEMLGAEIKAYTYDGDTPATARRAIRQAGHIVVTNPDMLHSGILPHHTKWVKLFENLKYVVIDEIHSYRGVFGANLANVIRRLKRICEFYGAHPVFLCCSATIANPAELTKMVIGREEVALVDKNGAPQGERHIIFYNPPVVNRHLGIRDSALKCTQNIAAELIKNDIASIVFAKARLQVEVMTNQLKQLVADPLGEAGKVRGYRSGYLASQRYEIERKLRAGEIRCVISTNALELGIDIGQLDACVLCGYPGTIASTWQQAGRAGRRSDTSLLIVVATSSPLDQYIMRHPDYFFGKSPEEARVNPDNLYILLNHVKCAAYELPFAEGELFDGLESTPELLNYLEDENILLRTGGRYHWSAEEFPQIGVNLRSGFDQNFLIIDITDPKHRKVIGEMDRFTVPMLLHQYAIYMHEGQQYQVEELDFDDKKAYVRHVNVDYYTDADLNTSLKVLYDFDTRQSGLLTRTRGEVQVTSIVHIFKKMKLDTQENLGFGEVTLPELEMHTTACWWTLPEGLESQYGKEALQSALVGLAHLIRYIAPVYLMCAPTDISVVYHVRDPFTGKPTIYLYDNCPGGVGLSDRIFEMDDMILREAKAQLAACPCIGGCPSCVGASAQGTKQVLLSLLNQLGL